MSSASHALSVLALLLLWQSIDMLPIFQPISLLSTLGEINLHTFLTMFIVPQSSLLPHVLVSKWRTHNRLFGPEH